MGGLWTSCNALVGTDSDSVAFWTYGLRLGKPALGIVTAGDSLAPNGRLTRLSGRMKAQ